MTLAQDLVAGMRANLSAEVGGRSDAPLGYGRDAWCVSSVADNGREVDPNSPLGMAQLAMRSCTTARDSCPDAPGRGFDVRRALNKGTGADELLAYEGMCISEIETDDRVQSVDVRLTLDRSPAVPTITLSFTITPKDQNAGPFSGVMTVPETGAAMLELLP